MTSGNAYPNQPEPDTSRERIELETRVLAAALRQSLERGDTAGSSHAHQQIFILLKTSQEMGWEEPISLPPELMLEKEPRRPMPDIDWGAPAEGPIISPQPEATAEAMPEASAEAPAEVQAIDASGLESEAAVLASNALADRTEVEPEAQTSVAPEPPPAAPAAPSAESAAARSTAPLLPLVTVPSFALIPVPSFTASAPATGAAAILDFYLRLQVSQMADFGSIHKSFLRKVRPLLRQHASGTLAGQARKDLLNSLQSLWIAHDILCDPVTRTDYDFRRMGLRGASEEGGEGKASVANRPQLRIGELLLCAGLLETTELEIAADMHKAMPELMFGAFLVKQGFIEEDDLSCVLLGQQLLKTGGITAAQFQESMLERTKSGKEFGDILVARCYLTAVQLQEAYRNQMDDTLPRLPVVVATVSLEASAAEVAEALNASDDESESETELASENVTASAGEVVTQAEELSSQPAPTPARARELLNSSPSPISSPVSSSPAPTASSSPALNIGNAVPSWKDQLDWDSPAESDNLNSSLVDTSPDLDAVTMPAQLNLAPSLASLYDTSDSRADTSELPPPSSSSSTASSDSSSSDPSSSSSSPSPFARPEATKKKSLTDLMAELEPSYSPVQDEMPEQSPFASIWADNSASAAHDLPLDIVPSASSAAHTSGTADTSSAANTVQRFSAQDDFAPPSLEHDEALSQVEEEFAALNAAADEALDIGEQEEMTATSELNAVPSSEQNASQPANQSANQSANQPVPADEQKGSSSSWQIVSVPASALASLLLEDEPEAGEGKTKTTPGGPIKERRQLKTSFANDKPFTTKSNLGDDKLPPDGDRRSKRRKSK